MNSGVFRLQLCRSLVLFERFSDLALPQPQIPKLIVRLGSTGGLGHGSLKQGSGAGFQHRITRSAEPQQHQSVVLICQGTAGKFPRSLAQKLLRLLRHACERLKPGKIEVGLWRLGIELEGLSIGFYRVGIASLLRFDHPCHRIGAGPS